MTLAWIDFNQWMTSPWLNTKDYSTFVLAAFGTGCFVWVFVYIIVIRDIIKKKIVNIPSSAICCNFAWEFYWGLEVFKHTDMGVLFQVAYFLWFFFDLFIVYSMFKYGWKQYPEAVQKTHVLNMAVVLTTWMVIFYFFMPTIDDKIGAFSGWIVNVYMSVLFVYHKMRQPHFNPNTLSTNIVAIGKFIGTGLCTSVVYYHFYNNKTLVALCFIFAIYDIIFIAMVWRGPKTHEPVVAKQTTQEQLVQV